MRYSEVDEPVRLRKKHYPPSRYMLILVRYRISELWLSPLIVNSIQAPTWLKDELKDGINVEKKPANFSGGFDDGVSSVDESAEAITDQDTDEEVFIKPVKDPPRGKKPGVSQDKTYSKYRTKAKGKVASETKIIGGVAMATTYGNASPNSSNGSLENGVDSHVSFHISYW